MNAFEKTSKIILIEANIVVVGFGCLFAAARTESRETLK